MPDEFEEKLAEEAQVLFDERTATTRWVVWRQPASGQISLAIVQKKQVVSVNVENLLHLCAHVLPPILRS